MSRFRPFFSPKALRLMLPLFALLIGTWCALAQSPARPGEGPATAAPSVAPEAATPTAPVAPAKQVPSGKGRAAYRAYDAPVGATVGGHGPDIAGKVPPVHAAPRPPKNWIDQSPAEAKRKSVGCMECHTQTDAHTMHASPAVVLGCTELEMVIDVDANVLPIYDGTRIHAEAAADWILGGE